MTVKTKRNIAAVTGVLLAAAMLLSLAGLHEVRRIVLVISTLIAGYPIGVKALRALLMKAFSIELLVSVAVAGALFIGEYLESAVVSFLFFFGAYLEARTLERTRSSIKKLMDMAPTEATVLRDGQRIRLGVQDVLAGDIVIIQSGDKVAVDGKIISGQGYIHEAAITGEAVPANKKMSDTVYSGTIMDHGYIEVMAEKIGADTTFAKIIELVEEAQESKTKTEKFLDRFAQIYTPAILFLSVIVYLVTRNLEFALTFLVIACPGALVISAPVSIVAGIGNGAKHGVLIKGGDVMEKLSRINAVVFDKTGTLTRGHPEVTGVTSFGMQEEELLRIAAEAELLSEHHLGRCIVNEAANRGLSLGRTPEDAEIIKGRGIRVRIAGQEVAIGSHKLMEDGGLHIPPETGTYAINLEKQGNTVVFVAVDGRIEGVISIADQVRPEAAAAIAALRSAGVREFYMLTGDNRHTAERVALNLGIGHVFSGMLPEEKAAKIQQLKDEGYRVAMIGDGINDAPAIGTADIGLAMGQSGSDVSLETADVVLMADRLDQFAHAFSLAQATVRNMKQNTWFAVGTVGLLLLGVLMQKVFLASGMFIHELSVLLVILNALRLVRYNSSKRQRVVSGASLQIREGV